MLRKIGRDFLILFCFAALALSTSRNAMEFLSAKRDIYYKDVWWGVHQNNHGDLASMSHLDFLSKFKLVIKKENKRAQYKGEKNTVLFLHGDSNTMGLADSVFAGVCQYVFVPWASKYNFHLDSTKRNVLVIEIGERILRDFFSDTRVTRQMRDTGMASAEPARRPVTNYAGIFPSWDISLFNRYINQNLEFNLFNYNFMMPMFGVKAALNLYLFDRASGDVVISKDKQFLFFKPTTDLSLPGSSFAPIAPGEIDRLVDTFNVIYDYYKASGFEEVYLSIVPSTVTIIEPGGYNNFIPMMQHNPHLRMKVIDIYSVFRQSKEVLFSRGDTHWNAKGKQMWVDMVNAALTQTEKNQRP